MNDCTSRRGFGRPEQAGFSDITLSLQDFLDAVPAGAIAVNEQGTILALNTEVVHQFGYEPAELLGRTVEILVPASLRGGHAAMRSQPFGSERTRTMGAGRPLHGQRKDGSVFPVEVGLRAVQAGGSQFVLAVVSDRSDHVRATTSEAHEKVLGLELAHQEVVAREMGHRVKNLMATVAALISLSARGAQTPKEMEESLRGRILALSSVIDLAFKSSAAPHGALSIEDILRAVLAPFMWTNVESGRVSLSGPKLTVGQRGSEVLALVFHELATNAIKYGALQHPDGKLFIDWHEADAGLELSWREEAYQLDITIPPAKGFGTILISRLIETEFRGRLDRQVGPAGWTTNLSIPATALGR